MAANFNGVIMERRGGAPELIAGGRDQRSPKIGEALSASALGARS
jgi:hypothetical protein